MNQSTFFQSLKSAVFLAIFLFGALAFNQAFAFQGDLGGDEYQAQEARRYQQVRVGVVEDIREVRITRESQSSSYVGAGLGAVVGGLLGNQVGNGHGRTAATAVAGMIGGVVGRTAGEYAGREVKPSAEIIVTLQNGNVVAVVQEFDNVTAQLRPGTRVRLIEGRAVRVVPLRSVF